MVNKCSFKNGKKVCKDNNLAVYITVGTIVIVIIIVILILLMRGCAPAVPADISAEGEVPTEGQTVYYCCEVAGSNGCFEDACPGSGTYVYEGFFNFENQCKAQCNSDSGATPTQTPADCDDICLNHGEGQYVGGMSPNGGCLPDYDPLLYQGSECCCYAGKQPGVFTPTCVDSDGGADFYTYGNCEEEQIDGTWTGYDLCVTESRLNEWTCNSNTGKCELVYHSCGKYEQCWQGTCIALNPN
jgi:hypothetical protein